MKNSLRIIVAVSLFGAAASAQLVITSLNQNGELTWTNSVSNATYRVEWAGSPTGPWQRMDVLTNLTSIAATSNRVTVKVPMFYRVVWTDAPPFAGTWNFSGFDAQSNLMVTGLVHLTASPAVGTWLFGSVSPTNYFPPLMGGELMGGSFSDPNLSLLLENQYFLGGKLAGSNYSGSWYLESSFIPILIGPFKAEKVEP